MKVVMLPATIDKIATRADNSVSIGLSTQDLADKPEASLSLFKIKGKLGWFLFAESEEELNQAKIPDEKLEFKSDISPSKRLRSALYVYWDKQTNKSKTFDEFYKTWIERKIYEIKETL